QAILALNKEVTDMDETIKLQQATITRQKEIIKGLQTQVNVLTVLESQLMELQKQLDSTTAD
ncbi:hypothetical protein, partial [Lactiplantibacillus plantarum]|uniref:hypothetical protein n=1 Tax=Lactiplantibacillus plantarum TaxID=1590 RepID=UPI001C9E321E